MRALLFTTGSPFARGIRILLDELGLDYERREEITTPTVAERAAATPTLQVPTFWDGEITLWESGLIAEYLLATYTARPDTAPPLAARAWRDGTLWQDKRLFATIQTLGTAAATIGQMKWSGINHEDNAYLTRCAERLPQIVGWLEQQLRDAESGFFPEVVSVQDIFLNCHIGYLRNRPLGLDLDIGAYPRISALLARLDGRDSVRANPILWWEPGVIGYAEDGRTPIYAK